MNSGFNSNSTLFLTTSQTNGHDRKVVGRPNTSPRVQRQPIARAASTEAFKVLRPARSVWSQKAPQPPRLLQQSTRPYPYYPPRRPIQRSMFADKHHLHLEAPELCDLQAAQNLGPSIIHAAKYTRTDANTSANESMHSVSPQPCPSPQTIPNRHQPLSSPIKALFDRTVFNFYTGLTHLQSRWSSAFHKEVKEKEILRAQYLKMQRERDLVLERNRELENRQSEVATYSLVTTGDKRPRDEREEVSIELPTPHTPPPPPLVIEEPGMSDPEIDTFSLVYPGEPSVSPSPPPPPISGRQLFFDTSASNSSITSFEDVSSSLLTPPASASVAVTFQPGSSNSRCSSPLSSNRVFVCSSSTKRRRLSGAITFEESRASLSPTPTPCPTSQNWNDSDGECDMDISDSDSSESESRELAPRHSRLGGSGKKLLFDDNADEVLLTYPYATVGFSSSMMPSASAEPLSSSHIPPLNLHDLNRMYFKYEGSLYCRACCSSKPDNRGPRSSPLPPVDASRPDLDILMDHCTSQHPVAYSDAAGLTLQQVFHLQKLLRAHMSSKQGAPITV
ncbi:hypothetical protein GYMLUDRAFT_38992 [Collybiopsis luxurians FD-317 M1]|nr:hypothetical protein GYMLUDRAFT_38992 [Collybiopsis luxurians FD-317 M1]